MKTILAALCASFSITLAFAQNTSLEWAVQMGGPDKVNCNSIAVDGTGNIYLTGSFGGTADLDPGPGTYNLTSEGGYDIFISKLDAAGNFLWAKRIGTTDNDEGYAIALDDSGNVYTTGYFHLLVDFDPGPGTFYVYNFSINARADQFMCKLNTNGDFVWATNAGNTGWDFGYGITWGADAHVYTVGTEQGPFEDDVMVVKQDAAGNQVWKKTMGSEVGDRATSIAVDAGGNVYTTGFFSDVGHFDPANWATTLPSAGGADVFLSKLDSAGQFVWAKSLGGNLGDAGHGIALDAAENLIVVGLFSDTADLDPTAGSTIKASVGGSDVFVTKLDSAGNFLWAKGFGGTGNDGAKSTAIDMMENIYIVGYFEGQVDFNPNPGAFNLFAVGTRDMFLMKLDAAGNFLWARQIGGTSAEALNDVAVDTAGYVYGTGYFSDTTDFDPAAGLYNLIPNSTRDGFVLKILQSGVGVEEEDLTANMRAYPNPTTGNFTLDLGAQYPKVHVALIDMMGRVVQEATYAHVQTVPMNMEVPAGVYLVRTRLGKTEVVCRMVKAGAN